MRRWFPAVLLLVGFGCAKPEPAPPTLQPGDVVRPKVCIAPEAPWTVGNKVVIGILLEAHRPGREAPQFLRETDVPREGSTTLARVTFFDDEGVPLAEPLAVPFVQDC